MGGSVESIPLVTDIINPIRETLYPYLFFETQRLRGPNVHTVFDYVTAGQTTPPLVTNYALETVSHILAKLVGVSLFNARLIVVVMFAI